MIAWIGLLFSGPLASQGCLDSLLQLDGGMKELNVTGVWKNDSAVYSEVVRLKSVSGSPFTITVGDIKEKSTNILAKNIRLTLSDTSLTLSKDSIPTIRIEVANLPGPGVYISTLNFQNKDQDCYKSVPLRIEISKDTQIVLSDRDHSLTIKTITTSGFRRILPPHLRQERISVQIENLDDKPVVLDTFSLILRGKATGMTLTQKDFQWAKEDSLVLPKGKKMVQLDIRSETSVPADEYEGELILHLYDQNLEAHQERISVAVTLFNRGGVGWALLALLLGVFAGRIVKDINQSKEQMPLMGKILHLRALASRLEDSRRTIELQLDELEEKTNAVRTPEERSAIEEALKVLEARIKQLLELEAMVENIKENLPKEGISKERGNELQNALKNVQHRILEGDVEKTKEALESVKPILAAIDEEGTRNALDLTRAIVEERIKKIATPGTTSLAPGRETSPFERYLIQVLAFLSGIRVTARLRYAVFRPLLGLITFLVILLLGFQEVYIKGGDTFGAGGIYDYLKVFLWGVVSDVFSRSLLGNPDINKLLGKE